MPWEIEFTDQFEEWWVTLREKDQDAIDRAVTALQLDGPTLGRPLVDAIQWFRHSNMKELRPLGTNIRILFAFDPRRAAIFLIGGDKTGQWNEWYERMIPLADQLYAEHIEELRREGDIR